MSNPTGIVSRGSGGLSKSFGLLDSGGVIAGTGFSLGLGFLRDGNGRLIILFGFPDNRFSTDAYN